MHSFKIFPLVLCLAYAAPNLRMAIEQAPAQLLTLPSNATSIRADISDSFSCEGRDYGYYADVENDCQLFHVCLPVTYASGRQQTFRWSFICPEETVFNQEMFTCTRSDDSINCDDSPRYYELNKSFGDVLNAEPEIDIQNIDVGHHDAQGELGHGQVQHVDGQVQHVDDATSVPDVPQAVEDALQQTHQIAGLRRSSRF